MYTDDLGLDSVEEVLTIAAEVVVENAPDPGNTRIERLSRWVIDIAGSVWTHDLVRSGKLAMLSGEGWDVVVAGELVRVDMVAPGSVSPSGARAIAAALLRAAEIAEEV